MQLNIALLGYTSDLSLKGLYILAYNNPEQVEGLSRHKKLLKLKDGTLIKAITADEPFSRIEGWSFDQLILFDDERWLIYQEKWKEIAAIRKRMEYRSQVPEEFRILEYEYI